MRSDAQRAPAIQLPLRFCQGPPFERAAADRAVEAPGVEDQPGTGFARRGTFDSQHRHHGARLAGFERPRIWSPDLHADIAFTALMIASGVAGASSGGILPGRSEAIASVMAENTDSASISGGSPTALER